MSSPALHQVVTRRARSGRPLACVLGDIDLVRALALAGVQSAVVAPAGDPARYSRAAKVVVDHLDHWRAADELIARVLTLAETQPEPMVLYAQTDGDLLAVSRRRDRLEPAFRFLLPEQELVEDLLDKERAQALAERLGLAIPPARVVRPSTEPQPPRDLPFPLLAKPLLRRGLGALEAGGKAVRIEDETQLARRWRALRETDSDLLLQTLVEGPETRIESYHAYIDESGSVAAEFTGRKVRTAPPEFGFTTAAETTDEPDVRAAGRQVLERLGLVGVAKVDFKRDPAGTLWLLEVNPRFNLWHHLGAVAGVNIPAMVHADLTGAPRPRLRTARPAVRWCHPWHDNWARKPARIPLGRWLAEIIRSEAKHGFAWDDPWPLMRGMAVPVARRRVTKVARKLAPARG